MARASHRDKLLQAGMRVVHARGLGAASVRDIVQAAGVPQGSFTNHFPSKEQFGLEIIGLYADAARARIAETLRGDASSPRARIAAFFTRSIEALVAAGVCNGCLVGNLGAETGACGSPIRARLQVLIDEIEAALAACLADAIAAGEISSTLDPERTARFLLAALEGAALIAKTRADPGPLEDFQSVVFDTILGVPG